MQVAHRALIYGRSKEGDVVQLLKHLALAAAICMPVLAEAQTIQAGPGPGGNPRITTPWGDYVAIRQGGTLFIVPEGQYAGALVKDYARQNGQEEVALAGAGKTYVSKSDVSVQAGAVRLRQVSASIVIGVPANKKLGRPPKSKTSEYVQVLWLQEQSGNVAATISVDGRAIKPNWCGADMGFYHCDFTLSHAQLTQPASVVFTQDGKVPGLWQVESISRAHYAELQRKYAEIKMPISRDDAADLAAIRKFDPAIPRTLN